MEADLPPNKPASATTYPRQRIAWLVVGHIVVGLMGACVAFTAGRLATLPTLRGAVYSGIMFSQIGLLGIWGGLGPSPWWIRLIGVVVGVAYLALLLGVGIFEVSPEGFFLVVLATTFVAIPLLIVRLFRVAIRQDSFPVASVVRIQFSIRHLMILTFVVACLITIGKWTPSDLTHGHLLVALPVLAVTFAGVGVLPVWFVLATKQPVQYSVALVAVGACAGYCFARIASSTWEGIYMTITATQAIAVAVSLLVVRSCGYRLVRLASSVQK